MTEGGGQGPASKPLLWGQEASSLGTLADGGRRTSVTTVLLQFCNARHVETATAQYLL